MLQDGEGFLEIGNRRLKITLFFCKTAQPPECHCFTTHISYTFFYFQGLIKEIDRLVYLSLLGIDSCHLMQGGGFALHVADAFFDFQDC